MNSFFFGGGSGVGKEVWEAWEVMYFNHTANANNG